MEASYQWFRNQLLRRLTLSALRRADKVFLLSQYAQKILARYVTDSKVTILPMSPPSPQVLSAADKVPVAGLPPVPMFVTAGTLYPYKGVQDAIHAVSRLKREGVEVALYVCGDPLDDRYARDLRVMAEALIPGSVVFLSHLAQREVLALMKRGVATLVCSRIENMSRVPVEAMAVGSVVISTRSHDRGLW
jgi:glycosyltransferase involved in cell wall biosynthesis